MLSVRPGCLPSARRACHRLPVGRVRGESLVSLMVGLTIGLAVMLGAGSMFVSGSRSIHLTLNATRLDQELQTIMALMAGDIRRAGYSATAYNCALSPACSDAFSSGLGAFSASTNQITYAFDTNQTGAFASTATFPSSASCSGFRLNTSNTFGGIDKVVGCPAAVGQSPTWASLTDNRIVNVTQLAFTVQTACSATHLAVRDVKIYLAASSGGISRSLCRRVHIDNDGYVASCATSSFSSAAPFNSAQCP